MTIRSVSRGRNFSNKMRNAFRLVERLDVDDTARKAPATLRPARGCAFTHPACRTKEIDDLYAQFRISEALMATL